MQGELDKKQVNRKLAKLAIPIAIQGVVSATLGVVDDLMVGRLGEVELAAVGVATQVFFIHWMLIFGLVGGSATFMAQFYGTNDMKNIRKVTGLAMTILTGVGVVFFVVSILFTEEIMGFYTEDAAVRELAVQYVRINSISFLLLAYSNPIDMAFKATQQTNIPLIVSTITFSSNTLLNYILIYGKFGAPMMGVAGAALGTAIARGIQFLLNIYFANRKANIFRGKFTSYFGWTKELVTRVVKNTIPTTSNELLWGLGQTMYVAAFNRIGTTDFAAYQAANAIANVFSFASFSVGDATLIMIGEKLGEGDKDYTWKLSKHLLKVGVILGLIFGAGVIAAAWPTAQLFKLSDLGQTYTFKILIVIGATMALGNYNAMHITGTLRAGGDTRFAMIAESSCVWLVAVPLAFLSALVWHLPIYWAVLVVRIEEVTKFFVLTKRYLTKKWLNTVIKGL